MNKNEFEISTKIAPGEVWFFINLSRLTTQTPDRAIQLVKEMGYDPQLRYVKVFDREEPALEVALLLNHQQLEPESMPDDLEECLGEKMMSDFESLWETFAPDSCVHLRRGLVPTKEPVPVTT